MKEPREVRNEHLKVLDDVRKKLLESGAKIDYAYHSYCIVTKLGRAS